VNRGDEVITPPNSFISSTTSIWHVGAKPVFVDVLKIQNINPKFNRKIYNKKNKSYHASTFDWKNL
jgi:dTDP-4-amino-4,6-dideoxygalactose transaminase